jgi:nucleoside-diphosphate-sugar epimerase
VALDATDAVAVRALVQREGIREVYQLVAMLSATGEKMPAKAWALNMDTLFIVLDMAKEGLLDRVFWPSSIAAFGPTTPRLDTPQYTVMDPTTVYGVSKLSGELWCQYYRQKFGVDVRSLRYPGLISWKTPPGGGTTDYAIDIFHAARRDGRYTSFLGPNTRLPMMHMEDAIRATLQLECGPLASPALQVVKPRPDPLGLGFERVDGIDKLHDLPAATYSGAWSNHSNPLPAVCAIVWSTV